MPTEHTEFFFNNYDYWQLLVAFSLLLNALGSQGLIWGFRLNIPKDLVWPRGG